MSKLDVSKVAFFLRIFSVFFLFLFREFYYIQMEKYARQALSEGITNPDDIRISLDSEIYRVLNLHYNRNNHIEVSGDSEMATLQGTHYTYPYMVEWRSCREKRKEKAFAVLPDGFQKGPTFF